MVLLKPSKPKGDKRNIKGMTLLGKVEGYILNIYLGRCASPFANWQYVIVLYLKYNRSDTKSNIKIIQRMSF